MVVKHKYSVKQQHPITDQNHEVWIAYYRPTGKKRSPCYSVVVGTR